MKRNGELECWRAGTSARASIARAKIWWAAARDERPKLQERRSVRPHPNPLPQERGKMTKATQAFELSGTVRKLALTPALSPGEREKRWQRWWNTTPLGGSAVSRFISGYCVRPHPACAAEAASARRRPDPLPQEREERWQRSWNITHLGGGGVFERRRNHATNATRAFELSSTAQNLSLSPGERAGVSASLPSVPLKMSKQT
jgi:hypothetical protein